MIKISIVSPKGHDVAEMEAEAAVDFIRGKMTAENKWVYIEDRLVVDPNDINLDMLAEEPEVTMANQLIGG